MESLILGAIYLDSAKLRAILIVLQEEGKLYLIIRFNTFNIYIQFFWCRTEQSFFFTISIISTTSVCRLFKVNGQAIFIRGGNWILSDGLLRLSKKRYSTDIKFHADMNFNMIRCWGGGLAERPEFYYYCDLYGLLVIFFISFMHFYCFCHAL